jgi:hypothetical protein
MIAIVMMDYMIKYPTYEHQVLQVELTEMGQLGLNNIPIKTKTSIKVIIHRLMDSTTITLTLTLTLILILIWELIPLYSLA